MACHGGGPADWEDHALAGDILPLAGPGLESSGLFVMDNDREPAETPLPGGAVVPSCNPAPAPSLYRRGEGAFPDFKWRAGQVHGEVSTLGFVCLWSPVAFLAAVPGEAAQT